MIAFFVLVCVSLLDFVSPFNLSPIPNHAIRLPMGYSDASLFGLSLHLRARDVIVGAPKASSSAPIHRNTKSSGTIFQCSISSGSCREIKVEKNGNINIEDHLYTGVLDSEMKHHQLLGFSLDGFHNGSFVVCAPKLQADYHEFHLMNGVCYMVYSFGPEGAYVRKIAPLRRERDQIGYRNREPFYMNMFAEQGLSVEASEDGTEVIMGAPGIFDWRGSLIRYHLASDSTEILDTAVPNLSNGSYLGYAVASSSYFNIFPERPVFVVSAPQADFHRGKVLLISNDFKRVLQTFPSYQMGEYFGYSLLAEDVNGDGIDDILIGAPLYADTGDFENGIVYVYFNQGDYYFLLKQTLDSRCSKFGPKYEESGRFGTSMAKLGDVNLDGYRDVAVGAPFEDRGAVYIFHGSSRGLVCTQKLQPESSASMFGFSLSRGVDIDANLYRDLAISAPGSNQVFIYKSYPVVNIAMTLTADREKLKNPENRLRMTACWSFSSSSHFVPVKVRALLKADMAYRRASWSNSKPVLGESVQVTVSRQCREYDVRLAAFTYSFMMLPLNFELTYEFEEKLDNRSFCSTCVVADPLGKNSVETQVLFTQGCQTSTCQVDLVLRSALVDVKSPFVIGSSKFIKIRYEVENLGSEPAFVVKLQVSLEPRTVDFARIPSECMEIDEGLECSLNKGFHLFTQNKTSIEIAIDTTNFDSSQLVFNASVSSFGEDINPDDNHLTEELEVMEASDIDIYSRYPDEYLDLNSFQEKETTEFQDLIYVVNNGPSWFKHFELHVDIFSSFLMAGEWHDLLTDFSVQAKYGGQQVQVNSTSDLLDLKSLEQNHEIPLGNSSLEFKCPSEGAGGICLGFSVDLPDFKAGKEALVLNVSFSVDVRILRDLSAKYEEAIFIQPLRFSLYLENVNSKVRLIQDATPRIKVVRLFPLTVALWILVAAVFVGLAIVGTMAHFLNKWGFFRRATKEEMKRLTQHEGCYLSALNEDAFL